MQRKKLPKEANKGLDPSLSALKLEHNAQLEQGKLYGRLRQDGQVLEFAQKDQNVVLFMTTVDDGQTTVTRPRRRPTKTATNARTSRAVFGDDAVKELAIPQFIDIYNHFIGGVDQLRSYYNTQRIYVTNWKPLQHFLLDTSIVDAYKISHCIPQRPFGEPQDHSTHKAFRTRLAAQLFAKSKRPYTISVHSRATLKRTLHAQVHQASAADH